MARRRSSTDDTKEAPEAAEEITEAPEDNEKRPPSARASSPPKSPSTVNLAQDLPDRTPQITIEHFVRGTNDPVLRAFAHHERLSHEVRKLTGEQWAAEFSAFKEAKR